MRKPLQGIKILDFSRLLPGPFCSHLLCEMGAQVTVLQAPQDREVLSFPALRKGKKFLKLDLKTPQGLKKARALIKASDVLLEGFRPGVMKRLGLDFPQAKKLQKRLIYASLSGYGQKGGERAGHDLNYLAMSGVLSALSCGSKPFIPGIPLADLVGGYGAAFEIMAQLAVPRSKRKAHYLDVSMTEAVSKLLRPLDSEAQRAIQPLFQGKLARYALYDCAEGGQLAVAPLEEKFWRKFAAIMGIPAHLLGSDESGARLWLSAEFKTKPLQHWLYKLDDPDLCVTPVNEMTEAGCTQRGHCQANGA